MPRTPATKVSLAEQIRRRPIYVTLPDTRIRIECRIPDPLELITSGLAKLEAFTDVLAQIAESLQVIQQDPGVLLDNRALPESAAPLKPKTYSEFLDAWTMLVVVNPAIVATEEEAIYNPEALWVQELDFAIKGEIYSKTLSVLGSPRVLRAVTSFRLSRSHGDRPGSDGAPLRDDAIETVARA